MTERPRRVTWAPALLLAAAAGMVPAVGVPHGAGGAAASGISAAVDSERQELPEGVTAEMVEAGRDLYLDAAACVTCHGEAGEGALMGPSLIEGEWVWTDGSYPALVEIVKTGIPEPRDFMRPMRPRAGKDLTDEQVAAVAAYVWLISRDR